MEFVEQQRIQAGTKFILKINDNLNYPIIICLVYWSKYVISIIFKENKFCKNILLDVNWIRHNLFLYLDVTFGW